MKRALGLGLLLALMAVGCSDVQNASTAAANTVNKAEQMRIDAANAPVAISALTDQTRIYECPTCQTDYDRAGKCPMDHSDLKPMSVRYICPADNQPAPAAGKCPRCDQEVRIEKAPSSDFASN